MQLNTFSVEFQEIMKKETINESQQDLATQEQSNDTY